MQGGNGGQRQMVSRIFLKKINIMEAARLCKPESGIRVGTLRSPPGDFIISEHIEGLFARKHPHVKSFLHEQENATYSSVHHTQLHNLGTLPNRQFSCGYY